MYYFWSYFGPFHFLHSNGIANSKSKAEIESGNQKWKSKVEIENRHSFLKEIKFFFFKYDFQITI